MGNMSYPSQCSLSIADTTVTLALRHKETIPYFRGYVSQHTNDTKTVHVPEFEWSAWLDSGGCDNGYGEYTCSTACVSDELWKEERCIIHAVAFRYGDRAWLIAGPSGVGKTTQVRNLQRIRPDDFQVICGDRPALGLLEDKSVFVYPSPWNGKENWKGAEGAPLAGIIFLERGETNSLSEMSVGEAVLPLLTALIHTGETEENIRDLAHFADGFLHSARVYKMVSFEVPAATELLYQSLFLNS